MTVWRKSTRSGSSGDCVEMADELPNAVRVRDSKDPVGPILTFDRSSWRYFVAGVRGGNFGHL
ncbi:DUF397 domain-containing protein [Micromonospora sp. NPDC050417]|uniref:DUF397 domain-containing protein n=1 Tax=Micromonospora sp. NPDC050417 TaxID=3364280 RepID=UPI0037B46136